MSNREIISRYNLIIKRVQKSPCTLKEIDDYLGRESELQGYNFNVAKRTFGRDLEAIRSLFNIDIRYDLSGRVYRIAESEGGDNSARLIEAFDTFNALNISEGVSQYIHFEKRKPQGTEHFYGLLHAIKNRLVVKFGYYKYWSDETSYRTAEPYALKEARGRWYLLARDRKDGALKTFGLDRISDLEIGRQRFKVENAPDVEAMYRDHFGIINPENEKAVRVVLSFTKEQGQYVKSYPLHHSQEVIEEKDSEVRIALFLSPTYDFIMELMSFGAEMKVLEPKALAREVVRRFKEAVGLY